MKTLVLQHIACEPPGVFEDVLHERGAQLHRVELDEGEQLNRHGEATLAMATALNPYIGYDRATEIVKEAASSGRTLREVAREHGVEDEILDKALDLQGMAGVR